MKDKSVTVQQLIDSLKQFDPNDTVQVAVSQYNKIFPVAYAIPLKSVLSSGDSFATKKDGLFVRIEIQLPNDDSSYMYTATRKK